MPSSDLSYSKYFLYPLCQKSGIIAFLHSWKIVIYTSFFLHIFLKPSTSLLMGISCTPLYICTGMLWSISLEDTNHLATLLSFFSLNCWLLSNGYLRRCLLVFWVIRGSFSQRHQTNVTWHKPDHKSVSF